MKILYQSFVLPELLKDSDNIAGGAAVEWYSWIKGIQENNFDFTLLTYKGAKDYIGKELGFEIIESYNQNKGIPILRWIYYRFPILFGCIKRSKPDIIILEGATAFVGFIAIISKMLQIPFVFRVANDPDVDERLKSTVNSFDYYLYKLGLFFTKYVVAQNSYQESKVKEKYPNKKVIVLYNPFVIENNLEDDLIKNREYIAWVANFRYQKNLNALYETAKKLPSFKFKIAGEAHPNLDDETKFSLAELKKLNNVEFVGYIKRSEIKEFFGKANVLLNTSRFEGFSNTFLEAWASGVPVISTQNVNPDNLISKYKLGLVAENYSELPEKIQELLNSSDYDNYVKRVQLFVKEHHDPKILAKKLVDFVI